VLRQATDTGQPVDDSKYKGMNNYIDYRAGFRCVRSGEWVGDRLYVIVCVCWCVGGMGGDMCVCARACASTCVCVSVGVCACVRVRLSMCRCMYAGERRGSYHR
jgi:hypothetical protein